MKSYAWNPAKNEWLIAQRGVSFERIIFLLESDALLDVVQHPNGEKYPAQRMFIVEIDRYAWLVPFVETDDEIFLKTAIPSRKATKRYLGGA